MYRTKLYYYYTITPPVLLPLHGLLLLGLSPFAPLTSPHATDVNDNTSKDSSQRGASQQKDPIWRRLLWLRDPVRPTSSSIVIRIILVLVVVVVVVSCAGFCG